MSPSTKSTSTKPGQEIGADPSVVADPLPSVGTHSAPGKPLAQPKPVPGAVPQSLVKSTPESPPTASRLPTIGVAELQELVRTKQFAERYAEFCYEIAGSPSLTTTPYRLAHEYQRLFQADRVWVLLRRRGKYRVRAVGGIPGFQRRAVVVRLLEELANRATRIQQPFSWTAGSQIPVSKHLTKPLNQYLDEAHVAQLRIESVSANNPAMDDTATPRSPRRATALVVCEWFQLPPAGSTETQWASARQQAYLALENASDWSRAPVSLWLRKLRRYFSLRRFLTRTLVIAAILVSVGMLAMLPMDETIDAYGELQPVEQRHVFATTAGVVKELLVNTGDEIDAGSTILTLDDPELELEIRRVEGELSTTQRRISTIEASRLERGTATVETAAQINTLAGEFAEQNQRKDNLQRELEILLLRRNQLEVNSPISGQVITWDLQNLLTKRPVNRGQRLVTVANTQGAWQVELRVDDEDSQALSEKLRADPETMLDFIVVTKPGVIRTAKIRELSESIEVRAVGEKPSLLCLAEITGADAQFATAGLGVRGRIHFGKKPAIIVGTRKLWRSIQENLLFPWGL